MFPLFPRPRRSPPPLSEGTDWGLILKLVLAAALLLALMQMGSLGWWIIGALVAMVALFVAANFAYMLYQLVRLDCVNWFGRRRTAPAAFIRKFERSLEVGLPLGGGEDLFGNVIPSPLDDLLWTHWVFWVVFQVEDQELEFRVPRDVYIELEDGMTGLLTYQGERFLRFKPMSLPRPAGDTTTPPGRWSRGGTVTRRPPLTP
jgi:hypothetical protein